MATLETARMPRLRDKHLAQAEATETLETVEPKTKKLAAKKRK